MASAYKLDYINMGLMVISLVLAFFLPFELFLFSYAVLGPLHYLTEISWLHQRNYFSTTKNDFWLLVFLCLLISGFVVYHDVFIRREFLSDFISKDTNSMLIGYYQKYYSAIILSALCTAIVMVSSKSMWLRIITMLGSFILFIPIAQLPPVAVWAGTFLPTLMHVYLFTGLFILYGALKGNSLPGYLSLGVFVLCTSVIFLIAYVPQGVLLSNYVHDAMHNTGFSGVNSEFIKLLKGTDSISNFDLFESRRGYMVQRFVAFAYTYHYLNWFSKTEIIKWHLVPKRWLIGSIVIWVVSVILYILDYRTGLIALFFLSLLHVFLEFPLNIKSVKGIFEEMFRLLKWGKTA